MEDRTLKSNSKRNTIIIAAFAIIIICCLCTGLAAAGGGSAYLLSARTKVITRSVKEAMTPAIPSIPEATFAPEDTTAPKETATPETNVLPSETPQEHIPFYILGLGVSRDEMEQFLGAGGAFRFGKPTSIQGIEAVMGTSSSQCIQTNCAAVTLSGPADDLLAVSVVAPTDPRQTAMACALLMTVSARFAQDSGGIGTQILTDITQAQIAQTNLNKTMIDNGYEFTIIYNPQTHNAGLDIARPKQ